MITTNHLFLQDFQPIRSLQWFPTSALLRRSALQEFPSRVNRPTTSLQIKAHTTTTTRAETTLTLQSDAPSTVSFLAVRALHTTTLQAQAPDTGTFQAKLRATTSLVVKTRSTTSLLPKVLTTISLLNVHPLIFSTQWPDTSLTNFKYQTTTPPKWQALFLTSTLWSYVSRCIRTIDNSLNFLITRWVKLYSLTPRTEIHQLVFSLDKMQIKDQNCWFLTNPVESHPWISN